MPTIFPPIVKRKVNVLNMPKHEDEEDDTK